MSSAGALYKDVMMDHYRSPRNHGDTSGAQHTCRVDNPLCGDELEVGVDLEGGTVSDARFRARGCAICIASGSMMTETVTGCSVGDARELIRRMTEWFGDPGLDEPPAGLPELLHAMSPVRGYPTRSRCVLLAWEALEGALED